MDLQTFPKMYCTIWRSKDKIFTGNPQNHRKQISPSKYSGYTVPFSTGDDLESDHYIVVVHLGKTYVSVDTCTALLTIKAAATVGTSTLTFMQLASPFVLQTTSKVASKPLCAACCNKHMFMYVD